MNCCRILRSPSGHAAAGARRAHRHRHGRGIDLAPHHAYPAGLEALHAFGLPIEEVLSAATTVAADTLGLADVPGALRQGLSADLIAVAGDPAADLRVLHRPTLTLLELIWIASCTVAGSDVRGRLERPYEPDRSSGVVKPFSTAMNDSLAMCSLSWALSPYLRAWTL